MLPVLNMKGSSQFVSCTIVLKFWVKLYSPTGYILILIILIWGMYIFDDISNNDPKS